MGLNLTPHPCTSALFSSHVWCQITSFTLGATKFLVLSKWTLNGNFVGKKLKIGFMAYTDLTVWFTFSLNPDLSIFTWHIVILYDTLWSELANGCVMIFQFTTSDRINSIWPRNFIHMNVSAQFPNCPRASWHFFISKKIREPIGRPRVMNFRTSGIERLEIYSKV